MQRWITKVLLPHTERMIELHQLDANAHILRQLDCWAVHKSEEYRSWLQQEHPRIHLVFVPANCTSKLQLADVSLQRPFKSCITQNFNQWAAAAIDDQIRSGEITGISAQLSMAALKPLVLQWCIERWKGLKERKQLILDGWEQSCLKLFDITSEKRRTDAVELIALKKLSIDELPEGDESDGYAATLPARFSLASSLSTSVSSFLCSTLSFLNRFHQFFKHTLCPASKANSSERTNECV